MSFITKAFKAAGSWEVFLSLCITLALAVGAAAWLSGMGPLADSIVGATPVSKT